MPDELEIALKRFIADELHSARIEGRTLISRNTLTYRFMNQPGRKESQSQYLIKTVRAKITIIMKEYYTFPIWNNGKEDRSKGWVWRI